jgi:HTH-type transcriptional regulator/antitoxin HigA
MPAAVSYEDLLIETCPQVIENDEQYESVGKRYGDLLGKQRKRTSEETRLMRLLGLLIEDYDRRTARPEDKSTPAELLRFLVDQSGKSAAELLGPIFGQRSHVSEALSGKRPISADQARKLGKRFSVKPGVFI